MPATALTWADVLKLCVPFVFSLVLLWAKQAYEQRIERRAKSEILWRSIDQSSLELTKTSDELDHIAAAYANDRLRLVSIVVPRGSIVIADRLAELDHGHAHVFSDFAAQTEIVRSGLDRLERLTDRAIADGESKSTLCAKAIGAQVTSIKRDFLSMAQSELGVLRVLKARNRRFDSQAIVRRESVLRDLQERVLDRSQ